LRLADFFPQPSDRPASDKDHCHLKEKGSGECVHGVALRQFGASAQRH